MKRSLLEIHIITDDDTLGHTHSLVENSDRGHLSTSIQELAHSSSLSSCLLWGWSPFLRGDSSHLLSPSDPWHHVASIEYHQNTEKQIHFWTRNILIQWKGGFQCLISVCWMVVMVSYCYYFQNPRNLQNYFTTRYDLVLYFWGEMNSSLELRSEQIRSRSKKKPKATHPRLQYEQDKFIFKDIY